MRDLWIIARYEFWRVVRQRRFLFFALVMPLFFVALSLIPLGIEMLRSQPTVGYVDQSGLLANPVQPEEESEVTLLPFETEEAGRAALTNEEIAGLWIIPEDYLQSGRVQVVAAGGTSGTQRRAMRALLQANLMRELSPDVAVRLQEPANFSYYSLDTGQRVRQGIELVFALLIPIGLAVVFVISIAFSSGFLAQAIAEEKENRLMEILATSTRIWSLIGGKVVGLGAVALTQVLFWGGGLIIAALIFFLRGEFPSGLPIPWDILGWTVPFFLLAYTLFATLLVGIGVIVGDTRAAQQLSGMLGFLAVIPIWFIALIMDDPSGTVSRFLTLFPFTAPTLVPVRMALGRISTGEVLLSLLVLTLSVALAIAVVSSVYRRAMLRYGTGLSINEMIAVWTRRG